jgi:hypothetical protein
VCSYFPGSWVSTSFFRRRSTKGRIMPCNRAIISSFWLAVPSIMLFMGLENQKENSFRDLKIYGIRKWRRDHSSIKLFCKRTQRLDFGTRYCCIRFSMPYLQGRSRQKQPPLRVKVNKSLPALALEVFDILGFIQYQVVPTFPLECKRILYSELVRCYHYMVPIRLCQRIDSTVSFPLEPRTYGKYRNNNKNQRTFVQPMRSSLRRFADP